MFHELCVGDEAPDTIVSTWCGKTEGQLNLTQDPCVNRDSDRTTGPVSAPDHTPLPPAPTGQPSFTTTLLDNNATASNTTAQTQAPFPSGKS